MYNKSRLVSVCGQGIAFRAMTACPTFCRLGYDVLESASCSAAALENLESGFSGD
jgi:hypothetical protein